MIYIYIHNYTAYTVHVTANWWKGFCSSSEHDRARTGPPLLDPLEQAGFCFASVGDGFVATKIEAFRWKTKKNRPVFQGQSDTMFNAATLAVWNTGGWFPPFFWRESGGFERKNTMRTWDFRDWSGWWYTYDTSHLFTYESCVRWMFDDNSGDDRCLMDDSSCH